jgi:hypothetical protein
VKFFESELEKSMITAKQALGRWGEILIAKKFACLQCKKFFCLRRLPANIKCADLICDFCDYLAQVKTVSVVDVSKVPKSVLGAARASQKARMKAGIYFPHFVVLKSTRKLAVCYIPTEFQLPKMFRKRAPLSKSARRAGWQGFTYNLSALKPTAVIRIL